jgi:hypothetical protein
MAINVYTSGDEQYGLQEQATWGTAITDGAAMIELSCEPFDIVPGVNLRRPNRSRGYRHPYLPDYGADQKGAEHIANIRNMPALNDELSIWLYGVLQNVSESATSNDAWKKTFTWANTQPDFSANAGKFLDIVKKMPVASVSKKMNDSIIRNMVLSCAPGDGIDGNLMLEMEAVGREYSETANPSGTWTKSAQEFFHFHDIATKTIAGTAVVIGDGGFSLTLNNGAKRLGGTSSLFETFVLSPKTATFQINALWDSTLRTEMANLRNGTVGEVILTWGTVDTDGYLSITLECVWDAGPIDSAEEGTFVNLTGVCGQTSGAAAPVTILHCDNTDRSW